MKHSNESLPPSAIAAQHQREKVARALIDGHHVYVDWADRHFLFAKKWKIRKSASGKLYVSVSERRNGVSQWFHLHRFILPALESDLIDHRDGNGLNNRRANLRIATRQENQRNVRVITGAVPFKGVHAKSGKYVATITVALHKKMALGTFDTAEAAARAYDKAAIEIFGEYAATNKDLGLLPALSAGGSAS